MAERVSYMDVYYLSISLNEIIEESWNKMQEWRLNSDLVHLCTKKDKCELNKENSLVREKLDKLKLVVKKIRVKSIGKARDALNKMLHLPDVVIDIIISKFLATCRNLDTNEEWLVEDKDMSYKISEYKVVEDLYSTLAAIYKDIVESVRSRFHDPLGKEDTMEELVVKCESFVQL